MKTWSGGRRRSLTSQTRATSSCADATQSFGLSGTAGRASGLLGSSESLQQEHFNNGKVELACYKCWIKATGIKDYQYEDGRVSRLFRNMAQRTKPSDSNNKTKQWLNWRVKGKLQKVSADQVQKLSMKHSGASDWVTSIGDGRVA
eukprot:4668125-Amphidinium_carterae.1